MKLGFSIAIAVCLASSTPAFAEGALVVGCSSNGVLAWGYQLGELSIEVAEERALESCFRAGGSSCVAARVALRGNGGWIAVAAHPKLDCSPFGWGYRETKAQAEADAISNCRKEGGRDCAVFLVKRNVRIYTVAPKSQAPGETRFRDLEGERIQRERDLCMNANGAYGCPR
jgi:hypothetical protein